MANKYHPIGGIPRPSPPTLPPPRSSPQSVLTIVVKDNTLSLGGRTFRWAGAIEPVREPSGAIREDMPQGRYANARRLSLNPHGDGPFCELSVPDLPLGPGVYAISVARTVVYVGRSVDLRRQWGPNGFGRISPANCFEGGQPTNCKVNNRILVEAHARRAIDLWIYETSNTDPVRSELIRSLKPQWNDTA